MISIIIAFVLIVLAVSFVFLFRNKKKEIILTTASVIVSLFIAEIILQLYYPQIMEHDKMFKYDANLGWKFVSNKKGNIIYHGILQNFIETNSMGFRDNLYNNNQEETKKIIVLGDSFVSNISVKNNEVFTEILEDKLDNTEVFNFGVNGYGQVQEFLQLKEWRNKIKPNFIILMIYIRNDFMDNMGGYWHYPRPFASWNEDHTKLNINPTPKLENAKKKTSGLAKRIFKKSHVCNLVVKRFKFFKNKLSEKHQSELKPSRYTAPELYLCQSELSENTELMYKTMEELLLQIESYSNEIGVPIVFALAPSIIQVEDKRWSSLINNAATKKGNLIRTFPNDRLIQFAKLNNLEMIDLLPILRSETNNMGKTLYHPFEQHWTSDGNRVVSNSLFEYIETNSFGQ